MCAPRGSTHRPAGRYRQPRPLPVRSGGGTIHRLLHACVIDFSTHWQSSSVDLVALVPSYLHGVRMARSVVRRAFSSWLRATPRHAELLRCSTILPWGHIMLNRQHVQHTAAGGRYVNAVAVFGEQRCFISHKFHESCASRHFSTDQLSTLNSTCLRSVYKCRACADHTSESTSWKINRLKRTPPLDLGLSCALVS